MLVATSNHALIKSIKKIQQLNYIEKNRVPEQPVITIIHSLKKAYINLCF